MRPIAVNVDLGWAVNTQFYDFTWELSCEMASLDRSHHVI